MRGLDRVSAQFFSQGMKIKNFFTQRMVDIWNELPEKVVEQIQYPHLKDVWTGAWIAEGYVPNANKWD